MSKLTKATHEGILKIGDINIDVAVLENGKRIITLSGIFKALDRPIRGTSRIDQIPTFMDAQNLQPFISEELYAVINKIEFVDIKGKTSEGYDATILPLVADLYLQARASDSLLKSQFETAIKAEILVRSLAKVGITALVDEATGYQYERITFANTVFTHFRAFWFGLVHSPLFSPLRGIQPSSSIPKKA